MSERANLTAKRLRELLRYEPETGKFTRLVQTTNAVHVGTEPGTDSYGYRLIMVDRRLYRASRLAWLYMIGQWLTELIDHNNLNRADDRWSNLRKATRSENNTNVALRADNKMGPTIRTRLAKCAGGLVRRCGGPCCRWLSARTVHPAITVLMAMAARSFWDWSLWSDSESQALEQQIHAILFPNIEFVWQDYCRADGLDPVRSLPPGKWRNCKCDVQAIWSIHAKRCVRHYRRKVPCCDEETVPNRIGNKQHRVFQV